MKLCILFALGLFNLTLTLAAGQTPAGNKYAVLVGGKEDQPDALIGNMKFVKVPKGTFWMGWDSDKKQSKQMKVEQDFELAAFCVTQGQWQTVMGNNPSDFPMNLI